MANELPAQVQRGLAEAEALEAQMATPPAAPEAPAPIPDPAPEPAPAAPPPAPVVEPWEARYRTLQGMYDTDVKSVRTENTELRSKVDALQKQLDAKVPAEPTKPSPPATIPGITAKDAEAFGDDLMEVITRAARALAAEQIAPLQAKVDELTAKTGTVEQSVEKVAATQTGDANAKFISQLEKLVPDWATINADPLFLKWCGEIHPLTGEPRQALLEKGANAGNAEQVANVFKAYKTEAGLNAPPAPDPAKAELETQIAPGTSKALPPPATQGERSFTTTEVEAFYRAVSKGEYKGREAEATALEAQIDAATAGNRIR